MIAEPIRLFDFQAEGLSNARAAFKRGARSVLLVGPTGMGKTTLGSAIVQGRLSRAPSSRIVWLAHRRELVAQAAERLRRFGLDVGAQGLRPTAPVQVTSVQTCLARRELPPADFVILDEAHHYVSDEWITIPSAYAAQGALVLGLTATPERDDGRGLGKSGTSWGFDELVVVAQIKELIALNSREPRQGLVPFDWREPETSVRKLAMDPVDAYELHTPGRSAVVFAPNVKSAVHFAEQFNARGISAGFVSGECVVDDRDGTLARFASGELRVICNVNVLTEGWDCPRADVAILARKIGSPSFYLQCVGRVLRPAPELGKRQAMIVDLSGNIDLHGLPDEERIYSLDGAGCSRKGALLQRDRYCRVCKGTLPREGESWPCSHPRACKPEPHCPECGVPTSKIYVPTAEDVELVRVTKAERMSKVPEDKRTKALATMYANGLRTGKARGAAHYGYRGVFKSFPPNEIRARAWSAATAIVAREKGDAWELPTTEEV